MTEGFEEAKRVIEGSNYTVEQIREYLDDLRDRAVTNMYGSGDFLMNVWGFTRHEVKPVVREYMRTGLREDREPDDLSYGRDRYKAEGEI